MSSEAQTAVQIGTDRIDLHGHQITSGSGQYRYRLRYQWDSSRARVCWVLLNPSSATDRDLDPTMRRVLSFSVGWGFGSADVVNLFACRATRPAALKAHPDPVGPDNDYWIRRSVEDSVEVVVAWGNNGSFLGRSDEVGDGLGSEEVACLGVTRLGHPRHPLYVAGAVERSPWMTTSQTTKPS